MGQIITWTLTNGPAIVAIGLALLRLVESILVVWRNKQLITIVNVIKEFFRLG